MFVVGMSDKKFSCLLFVVGVSSLLFLTGLSDQNMTSTKDSTQSAHRQLSHTLKERDLVADIGATMWQSSYGVSLPPYQVSTQLAHRKLNKGEIP